MTDETQITPNTILDCGHAPTPQSDGSISTGYGRSVKTGATACYQCCADNDRADMIETGRAVMYLSAPIVGRGPFGNHDLRVNGRAPFGPVYDRAALASWSVGNWPSSLKFDVQRASIGRHNIAGRRFDVWINGPDGHVWHCVTFGDWTQIAHCQRTAQRWTQAQNASAA